MGHDDELIFGARGHSRRPRPTQVTLNGLPAECQDAGQDPDPLREPWFTTLEQKRRWRARWRMAVKQQRSLIAEVLQARQAGAVWPDGWSEAKQAQYLAAPSVHANVLQELADARPARARVGPGSGADGESAYLEAMKPYINFGMAELLREV